ncbi:hypothetical protein CHLRE_02g099251v5 [Chlamydomonas reinhardtii]|uniref:CAAX prenyl protease 2/Lysostaphin resistance protein A-like domain-containing protein n=1 Tax=Chlamydomonas reinhardtii TaxID=3055 RepID=A0A2K3E258_CHLRE|nr:uncharacterized protein CHLRE_02g099251v5 [Chlamydomonas reinhardtii]PNW86871.1 hypothetical protein CHLRE_02g099251v5 [Chlamydomonas reinhardtii]
MQALHAQLRRDLRPRPFNNSLAAKRSCPNARRYGPCVTSGCAASRGTKAAPCAPSGSRADAVQASAPHPSPNSLVSVSPTAAVILATQATCLNLVVGLSATPLVCSIVGSGACGAPDAGGAAVPAQVAIPAVLLAAAAQASGTGALVLNEFRGEVLKQQQRVASGVSDRAARGTMADTVAALGMRWSGGAVVWGAVTAAAAAASVAAISLALTAISDESTAPGNTQALREALLGADASGNSSSGGGGLPLPLLAAALLLAECVMAPLAEELVFRRVLLDALVPAPSPVPVPEPAAAPAEESGATLAEVQQDVSQQLQLQRGSDAAPQPDAFATALAPEDAAQTPAAPSAASPSQTPATPAAAAAPAPPPAVLAWRPEWSGPLALQATVFAAYHLNANEMLPQAALGGVLGWAYLASGRNLAVTLMGHTMYNGAAVALLLFQR